MELPSEAAPRFGRSDVGGLSWRHEMLVKENVVLGGVGESGSLRACGANTFAMRSLVRDSNAHEMPVHGCMARILGCESTQSTSNSLEVAMQDHVNMQQARRMHEQTVGIKRGNLN